MSLDYSLICFPLVQLLSLLRFVNSPSYPCSVVLHLSLSLFWTLPPNGPESRDMIDRGRAAAAAPDRLRLRSEHSLAHHLPVSCFAVYIYHHTNIPRLTIGGPKTERRRYLC